MAKVSKFDKLIELVIAEGKEKQARALFHQIVVESSRKIYEGLDMDSEPSRMLDDVEADHTADEELEDDGFEDEGEEFGGDEADDLETDVFSDEDEEMKEGGDELNADTDDRLADLEQEFDSLKAEFEEFLDQEEGEHEEDAEDFEEIGDENEADAEAVDEIESDVEDEDLEDEGGEEDGDLESEEEEEEESEETPVDESVIREYVDKVTKGLANETEEGFVNKKSPVAGKNEIVKGVNAKNLNQGGESKGRPVPTSKKFTEEPIVNVPGGKAALKPVKKPTNKEGGEVNKKSVEA